MAVIMQSEASVNSAPSLTDRAQELFLQTLRFVLSVLTGVFLPHIMAGVGLFMVTGFVVYHTFIAPLRFPFILEIVLALLILLVYGGFAFLYCALTACVFSVHAASVRTEEFFDDIFALIKEKVQSKISAMDEGVAKEQAKVVMKNSITEVFSLFRNYKLKSFPALVASVLLAALTWVTKAVFVARVMQLSGSVVSFSAVFASRATLVGAIFLNLRLLSTMLLWVMYGLGAVLLAVNFAFVFMSK